SLAHEVEALRQENDQLRQLCADLEQALQEATCEAAEAGSPEARVGELEGLLEEKTETIRRLYQELDEARAAQAAPAAPAPRHGPIPREEELLALSEELEAERRQLQDDERSLMEQMRQMELGMARERAERARRGDD